MKTMHLETETVGREQLEENAYLRVGRANIKLSQNQSHQIASQFTHSHATYYHMHAILVSKSVAQAHTETHRFSTPSSPATKALSLHRARRHRTYDIKNHRTIENPGGLLRYP
ncbi:hypothetical protein VNO77_33623 [Canavalia gladiata]|uniref:Uncharacterized protein n=1 Tax=Canavalia gladiata TaxID=3824 RepID=A0AAN9KE52_CANGL